MKKYTITIIKKDGSEKKVKVLVDDQTAKILDTLSEEERNQYLQGEHEVYLNDLSETRRHQSLDASVENGFDIADDAPTPEETTIANLSKDALSEAIRSLRPKQQWLVEQVFFLGRKQRDVAKELGIDESVISHRLNLIYSDLKKILKNF